MASFERSVSAEGVWKACIICKTYQPRNGKFLSCLHVICAGCLGECTSRDGSVSCLICKSSTSPKVVGIELAKQLAESSGFLYGDDIDARKRVSRTESSEIAFCDTCNDMDVEKEASHDCVDCNGLPLCESHAEKHPKKRAYSGHRVHVRAGQTSFTQRRSTSSSSSKRCMYHSMCNVVTYCQTCRQCICAECIEAGGHEGHQVESLASAAAKQRTRVVEVFRRAGLVPITSSETIVATAAADIATKATTPVPMNTSANIALTSGTSATATTANRIMPATGKLLAVFEKNIATVTEEASVASNMATDKFDKIEKMVKQQRERILNDIDHRLWSQLDPLEAQKTRLESLHQRQAAIVEVATRLSSPGVCPEDVLQVADTVIENMLTVSRDLQAEQTIESPPLLFVEVGTLDGIQAQLEQCIRVLYGGSMDISKSIVELPGPGSPASHEIRVVVKLADSNGRRMPPDQPTPDIVSAIILPSGTKQAVQLSSSESDSSKLVIPISAADPGTITLELSSHGVSFRSRIPVSPHVSFDPQKSHDSLVLSNGNRVATYGPGVPDCASHKVLATEGYTTGRHEWAVRVIKGTVHDSSVSFGVRSTPSEGNYNNGSATSREKSIGRRTWNTFGTALKYKPTNPFYSRDPSAKMQKVLDGDVLAITLDCDARTLQCLNQRTQEAAKFTDIDCSKPLYPSVGLRREGQSVEILTYP